MNDFYPTRVSRERVREIVAERPDTPPHCNETIVHAPGDCVFCDETPGWQDQRLDGNYDPVDASWGGNSAVADIYPARLGQVLLW